MNSLDPGMYNVAASNVGDHLWESDFLSRAASDSARSGGSGNCEAMECCKEITFIVSAAVFCVF